MDISETSDVAREHLTGQGGPHCLRQGAGESREQGGDCQGVVPGPSVAVTVKALKPVMFEHQWFIRLRGAREAVLMSCNGK